MDCAGLRPALLYDSLAGELQRYTATSIMFSRELVDRAMRAGNGELAFSRGDVSQALRELRAAGLAVLGGEVWLLPHGGPQLISTATGELAVYSWNTDERRGGEPWDAYVSRCAAESIAAAESIRPEDDLPEGDRHLVRFNLSYVTPTEHATLRARSRPQVSINEPPYNER